jgi:hypothetical protein
MASQQILTAKGYKEKGNEKFGAKEFKRADRD